MTQPTASEDVLKPCPFCGGKAFHTKAVNGSNKHTTACQSCRGGFRSVFGEHAHFDTVLAWNMRTQVPSGDRAMALENMTYLAELIPDTEKVNECWGYVYDYLKSLPDTAALSASPAENVVEEKWRGICKLVEEQGEVLQLIGKLMAYPDGEHPDGKGNLFDRLHEELADLGAAREYFLVENGFDLQKVEARKMSKFFQFKEWIMSGIVRATRYDIKEKAGA